MNALLRSLNYSVGCLFSSSISEWLEHNAGRGNYSHSVDSIPGVDAVAFYFMSPERLGEFLEMFDLKLTEMHPTLISSKQHF